MKMKTTDKRDIEDIISLTPMQQGILFHYLESPASELFFEQLSLTVSGDIDIELLERAWNVVIETNEMLRAIYRWEDVKNPIQIILKSFDLKVRYYDFSKERGAEREKLLARVKRKDRRRGFDLRNVPFRITLCKLDQSRYEMIVSNHHILYDGWSSGIILKEFQDVYDDLVNFNPPTRPLKTKFKTYVKWLHNHDVPEQREFWKDYLKGVKHQQASSSKTRRRKEIKSTRSYRVGCEGDRQEKLAEFLKKYKFTLSSLFHSAWGILLQQYFNRDDVIYDITVSGRSAEIKGVESMVGLFIRTLPLRIQINSAESILDLLHRTGDFLKKSEVFGNISPADLQSLGRPLREDPFDSVVVIENYPLDRALIRKNDTLSFDSFSVEARAAYDLTVMVTVFDGIELSFTYNTAAFSEGAVKNLSYHFLRVIDTILDDPGKRVHDIDLLPEAHRAELINSLVNRPAALTGQHKARYAAPCDEVEEKLVEIWAEVLRLKKENLGVDESFFDFGGHSLKVAMLVNRVHEEFDVSLPFAHVFSHPTVRELSKLIRESVPRRHESIPAAESKEYYALASAQERLFMLQQMEPESTAYNGPMAWILDGRLDRERLARSFQEIINRHESLRTSFQMIGGVPVQRIHGPVDFEIEYQDEMMGEFSRAFDLSGVPLLRVRLVKLAELKQLLMLDMHHIITDGTSVQLLIKELSALYKGEALPTPMIQYREFSEWQHRGLRLGKLQKQEQYWLRHLAPEVPVLSMPLDYPRPLLQDFSGDRIPFRLGRVLSRKLYHLMRETNTTLFMVLLAAYNILLGKYTGQANIVIGFPSAGRAHRDLENIVGLLMDTLVVRNCPAGEKRFDVFLREVKERTLESYHHQEYPFRELVKKLGAGSDLSRNPLFGAMLNVRNQEGAVLELEGARAIPYRLDAKVSKVDVTVEVVEGEGGIIGELEYCSRLFKRETMARFGRHFVNIIGSITANYSLPLAKIDMMGEGEKRQILFEFNDTVREDNRLELVPPLLAARAARCPDRIAVVCGSRQLAYGELAGRSGCVAALLRVRGVGPNDIIGLMLDRCLETVVGIVGVLKSGGAYLPLDPTYPEDRIRYMLGDSRASILLTQTGLIDKVQFDGEIIELDEEIWRAGDFSHHPYTGEPADLAYVIYTSGTTGRPKGVLVRHGNLTSYVNSFLREFPITPDDVILQQASYSFDAFVEELFPCLLKGGRVAMVGNSDEKDIARLAGFIARHRVSMVDCSPLLLNEFNKLTALTLPGSVHTFISGGDVLKGGFIDNLALMGQVYNTYGPTETTVCAAYYRCPEKVPANVPIGRPIANCRVYILDRDGNLLPIGVPGELCIAGKGLTRGYLNRPELTARKFVAGPGGPQEKIYKSGDLARWLPDGDLEFLGRLDRQVNIRGFRIELREIEACLLADEDIKEVAAVAREDEPGTKYIAAYFVADREKSVKELRTFLLRTLPPYMIPAYFIQLHRMPLKALPDVGQSVKTGAVYEDPRNRLEEMLISIWQEVLKTDRIGIHDHFFELGGDSILANQSLVRMREELQVEISLKTFFEKPTVSDLAGEFARQKGEIIPIERAPRDGEIPLSFAQERIWFLQNLDRDNTAYHVPRAFRIRGKLDVALLERTFTEIIRRHEILRTVFPAVEGRPVQRIHKPYGLKIPVIDLSRLTKGEQQKRVSTFIIEEGQRRFDLEKGPLLRINVLQLSEAEHVLVSSEHHLIHDGWTQGVLLNEFITIFTSYFQGGASPLPELPIQYADFACWQRKYLQGERLEKHLQYWQKKLSALTPVLELPKDRPRPSIFSGRGVLKIFHLSEELSRSLKTFSKERGGTLFMTMLAIFKVLLYRYSGEQDICVGTGLANRKYREMEGMLGMVINTLPLRTRFSGDLTFEDFFEAVRTTCVEAYEHEDTPFEKIVENLQPERSLSYTPIFQVMFSFMDTPSPELALPGLELVDEGSHNRSSKFDINIVVVPGTEHDRGEIEVEWEYNVDIFEEATIDRMIDHYIRLQKEVVLHPGERISVFEILSAPEKRQILYEWNDTEAAYSHDRTIHRSLEEQAARTTSRVAVIAGRSILTYGELNRSANKWAGLLREGGLKANEFVGVAIDRSLEMIVGVVAILKAGGAYAPVEPHLPEIRLIRILGSLNLKNVLTNCLRFQKVCQMSKSLPDLEHIYCLDGEVSVKVEEMARLGLKDIFTPPDIDVIAAEDLQPVTLPEDLAYVIFTSGSTGTPKGVAVKNRPVMNVIEWVNNTFAIGAFDKLLFVTSLGFDLSVYDMFGILSSGAAIRLASIDDIREPRCLLDIILAEAITFWDSAPATLQQWLPFLEEERCCPGSSGLRLVFLSGDWIPLKMGDTLKKFFPGVKVIGLGGATEATIWSNYFAIERVENQWVSIPYGKPIQNARYYILDSYLNLCPIGVAGDLYIGGECLSTGYINDLELTAAKFRDHPFLPGEKVYQTGDRARWFSDGNIEFLGRIDNQVKIRGYRIEMGEIETQLMHFLPVKSAVVKDIDGRGGEKRLAAYIVPDSRYAYTVRRLLELKGREGLETKALLNLPNGMTVFHMNRSETDLMYREIFEEHSYLQHGVALNEGDCVFDVGANIGLFSLFASRLGENMDIFAFEPLPPLYEILNLNAELYGLPARIFNYGLASEDGQATFTYYPHISIFSGRFADVSEEAETVKAYIHSQAQGGGEVMLDGNALSELLEEQLTFEPFTCPMKTISQVIKENRVNKIDLLKINVEKSEMDVLAGIEDEDWPRIRQLVIEVHDVEGRLGVITRLLAERGYRVKVEQGMIQENTRFYDVYAVLAGNDQGQGFESVKTGELSGEPESRWYSEESLIHDARQFLKRRLPSYMIPSHFVLLEHLPLTPSGKVDRRALPEPDKEAAEEEFAAPRDHIEQTVASIWAEVLGIEAETMGIDHNFFRLGGHSLNITLILAKIHKELKVKLPLMEAFGAPTVRGFSDYVRRGERDEFVRVEAVEAMDYFPLSSAQKRMYVLQQMDIDSTSYNVPAIVVLQRGVHLESLESALKKLIERHESLRTSFEVPVGSRPVQKIHPEVDFKVELFGLPEEETEREGEPEIDSIIERFVRPFDLASAPLFRVGLIRLEKKKHVFMLDMHHIITDAVSIGIFVEELVTVLAGKSLPEPRIHYKDYAVWQNRQRHKESIKKQERYWLNQFGDEMPILNLPLDFSRTLVRDFEGSRLTFELDEEVVENLRKLTIEEDVTPFMVLLTTLFILLCRLSGQEDVVAGSPIAGRRHPDLPGMIGMFVNTLVLRAFPVGLKTFKLFLAEVKRCTLNAFENQDYQFEDLVENLSLARDTGRNPLFDVMFAWQNRGIVGVELPGLGVRPYDYKRKISKFDLTLMGTEEEKRLCFTFEYCTNLFKGDTVRRFIEYFKRIVFSVLEDPGQKIAAIEVTPEGEKNRILYCFNDTQTRYPRDKTIHDLFEEQVGKGPNNIAVVGPSSQPAARRDMHHLTYKELNRMANQLAAGCSEKGVQSDDIVGIMVESSVAMIVGLLGILKGGGLYMPINPEYPVERKRYMLADGNVGILLTDRDGAADYGVESINLNCPALYERSGGDLFLPGASNEPAYLIYTSGSSGNPKGVMVAHRSVVRLVRDTNYIRFNPGGRILQTGALEFDASTFEIWGALLNGLTLYLASKSEVLAPGKLGNAIGRYDITTMWMTSPLFNQMLEAEIEIFSGLENFLVGGDILSPRHINLLREKYPGLNVINGYGPTENTTFSTTCLIDKEYKENIPIGSPIANSTVYIVDKYDNLQMIGVPGELCVGGDGLGRGYLNAPELTAEKFVLHSPVQRSVPERIYRTGDLARWLPDGNIEFLGRMDHQVKIRGFRIELGEIESQLLKNEEIGEAVVLARPDQGADKCLCAYFTASKKLDDAVLRDILSRHLPDHMRPSYFIQLESMPLTPNGKIDRRALPEPEFEVVGGYRAPANEIEDTLAAIWSDLLSIDKHIISTDADFFDLGGHSLKATMLAARIHQRLDIVVPLVEIFHTSTIGELAASIRRGVEERHASIGLSEKREYYVLSSVQKRMYVLQLMDPAGVVYNVPQVMELAGEIDREILGQTFRRLIQRHESLRTSFEVIDEEPVQKIHNQSDFEIEFYDLSGPLSQPNASSEDIIRDFVRPFNLSQPPLMRAGLVRLETKRYLFMLDMHHTISDGLSQQIFFRDFLAIYPGEDLPLLKLQYRDYARWQYIRKREGKNVKEQEAYWLAEFSGEIPVLSLPLDYGRPAVQSFEGRTVRFKIDGENTRHLKVLAKGEEVTLFMLLLALFNVFLSKLSGDEDIIVGTPMAGRRHADLQGIIGMFVNTLALRNFPRRDRTFGEFLQEVKGRTLLAFESQEFPFEEMVEKIGVNRDVDRNPLFHVMFVFQNQVDLLQDVPEAKMPFVVKPYHYDDRVARFDLTLTAVESKGRLLFAFQYCTRLWDCETMERFVACFRRLLSVVLEDRDKRISHIEIIPEDEKRQILGDFAHRETGHPGEQTIHGLFERQVTETPDHIAVVGPPLSTDCCLSLTYTELNRRANQLAWTLKEKGVSAGGIVGIMVDQSIEMAVGIFAVLKSAGGYLSIDPEYPAERIIFMLQDSGAQVLLHEASRKDIEGHAALIDVRDGGVYSGNSSNPGQGAGASHLAYVIYTSGTTGRPKGVVVDHMSAVHTLLYRKREYEINPHAVSIQLFASTFDGFVTSFFTPLISGARIVVLNTEGRKDLTRIREKIVKQGVTHLISVPILFQAVVEYLTKEELAGLEVVTLAGDRMSRGILELLVDKSENLEIAQEYGVTEAAVMSTICRHQEKEDRLKIGRPIWNTKIYILDQYLNIQPIGVPGELCIGGTGLSRGYLNNPELTKARFVANPYKKDECLYHSGDLARWLPDGNIEFLGRIDHQVKIRGFRIETAEIESQLSAHPHIKEAVVISREEAEADRHLAAYVIWLPRERQERAPNSLELRDYLSRTLPDYMLPSSFVELEAFPLTASGKLDRNRLPKPEKDAGEVYAAPRDRVEQELARIWSQVLRVEMGNIGIDANFFDWGGHSLKAASMVSKIRKELNAEVPLSELFRNPTIRRLSRIIKNSLTYIMPSIGAAEKREYYPLSSAQNRMFVLNQIEGIGSTYNLPLAMMIEGKLDRPRMEKVFRLLIARHENLRTSFDLIDDRPVQVVMRAVDFKMAYTSDPGADIEAEVARFIRPFHLNEAPLFRVMLIALNGERHVLLFDMHHIVGDGVSVGMMMREFVTLYGGGQLPAVDIQYKDFAIWQEGFLKSQELKKQEAYWLNQFKGELPSPGLPTDYPKPDIQRFFGRSIRSSIGTALTGKIKKMARETESTLFMVLLAAFYVLLFKYTDQKDIIIGTPTAGRNHEDVQYIIGNFVNTLPIWGHLEEAKSFRIFLEEVKRAALKAFENQDYPFEELVNKLKISKSLRQNPLFDVLFVSEIFDIPIFEIEGLTFTPYEIENKISHLDLVLYINETGDGLGLSLEYSTSLFKSATAERLVKHYEEILAQIVENSELKLMDVAISHSLLAPDSKILQESQVDFDF